MAKILEESKVARDNRAAQVSIFVIDTKYAQETWQQLDSHGDAIVVKWSPDIGVTNHALFAAFALAAGLCVKNSAKKKSASVDYEKVERAVLEVQKRTASLEDVTTYTQTIIASGNKILDRVRINREALQSQVEVLLDQVSTMKES